MSLNQYFVVLYKKGPNWTEETSPELEKIQKMQLAQLAELYSAGKLAIAGPVDDHSDTSLRAMAIFYRHAFINVDGLRAFVDEDELVKSQHLVAEFATWYFPEGQTLNTRHAVHWTAPV